MTAIAQEFNATEPQSPETTSMPTETISVRTSENREARIEWNDNGPLHLDLQTRVGDLSLRQGTFRGGVSEGVEIVRLSNSQMHVDVLPTRGMSIWRMRAGDHKYQWDSPVLGPVHPTHVPLHDPSGLGWLSGFDELVVRCGLESNGAPQFDSNGVLQYPLHGQIGNTPADALSVEFDEASGRIELVAETVETRLFFKRLRLKTRIRIHADRNDIELLDDVTNELSTPTDIQLLYHINVGLPLLGEGSKLVTAVDELAPKDELSASEIEFWNQYGPPQSGYSERVYFAQPRCDDAGLAHAMLTSEDQSHALAVSFKTSTLPHFVLWKNTAETSDGYVTGLEPATGFPNTRQFEQTKRRLVGLDGGQTTSFRVTLKPLTNADEVQAMSNTIETLASQEPVEIATEPRPDWSDLPNS